MKKHIHTVICLLGALIFIFPFSGNAQKESEAISPVYSFSIRKEIKPPLLTIVEGSIQFRDKDGNNVLNAGEVCTLEFEVLNDATARGAGYGLYAEVKGSGTENGVTLPARTDIAALPIGEKKKVSIPISSDLTTETGTLTLTVTVKEPNGFGSDPIVVTLNTKKFVPPLVKVVDYTITGAGATLQRKKPFTLKVLVQNLSQGTAEQVKITLNKPSDSEVYLLSGKTIETLERLKAGESQNFSWEMIISDQFLQSTLNLTIDLTEQHGKYAQDTTITLVLNQGIQNSFVIKDAEQKPSEINQEFLRSDIDINIPTLQENFPNRFALIIGNEDYASRSMVQPEQNVPFAVNDANSVEKYMLSVLGIPQENIRKSINATAAEMRTNINWLIQKAGIEGKEAELFFYYAGHGFPVKDATTNEEKSYLIPVDVSGGNAQEGIPLSWVYKKLQEKPCKKVTVILDACFSGAARNKGLLADNRAILIKPVPEVLGGNLLVFASSSGDEPSNPFNKQQHGLFTYYFLKALQNSNGNITYQSLQEQVQKNVRSRAVDMNREQTPEVLPSPELGAQWQTWTWR